MSTPFSIGQLASRTATRPETIRYYERIGLLAAPMRSAGNYRFYGEDQVQRLRFIRRSRELGFSIGQIRELVGFADRREQDCADVDNLVIAHIRDIEGRIRDLQAMHVELGRMIDGCPGGRVGQCRVLGALDAGQTAPPQAHDPA